MSTTTGSIHAGNTVLHPAQKMRDLNLGCLTVEDDTHELAGIITDRDITLHLASGGNPARDLVSQVTTGQHLTTISPEATLDDALMAMMLSRVRRLPVMAGTHLVGVISAADLAFEGVADAGLDAATPQ